MSRHLFPAVLTLATLVCAITFKDDASALALFGCILLSSAAAYVLFLQSRMSVGKGFYVAGGFTLLSAAAIVAGVSASKYPYLSLVVSSVYGALAVGQLLGYGLGSELKRVLGWLTVPACGWTAYVTLMHVAIAGQKHSLFADSNSYATVLNIAMVLALIQLTSVRTTKWARIAAWVAAAVSLAGLFFVQSKGAWLALVLTLSCVGLTVGRTLGLTRRHWVAIALVAGVAVASVSVRLSDEVKDHRDGNSSGSRKALLIGTLQIIKEHPMGVGIGQWFRAYQGVRNASDVESAGTHAHNDYLEATAEAGPLGLLMVSFPGLLALAGLGRLRKETDRERVQYFAGLIALVGVCAVQALVNFTYQQVAFTLLTGLACGGLLHLWWPATVKTATPSAKTAATSMFAASAVIVSVAAMSFATLNAQSLPVPRVAKILPFLRDERFIILMSNLNRFDTRPRLAYASLHSFIAANTALPVDLRMSSYNKAMSAYMKLNQDIPDDFQLLASAGSMAHYVGEKLDKRAVYAAEALLQRANELAPTEYGITMPYAEVLFSLGKFDEAERVVKIDAEKGPLYTRAKLNGALEAMRKIRPH